MILRLLKEQPNLFKRLGILELISLILLRFMELEKLRNNSVLLLRVLKRVELKENNTFCQLKYSGDQTVLRTLTILVFPESILLKVSREVCQDSNKVMLISSSATDSITSLHLRKLLELSIGSSSRVLSIIGEPVSGLLPTFLSVSQSATSITLFHPSLTSVNITCSSERRWNLTTQDYSIITGTELPFGAH